MRFEDRVRGIGMLVLDVDGVLTDGSLTKIGGRDCRRYYTQDGVGLILLALVGIQTAIVTGKRSYDLPARAKEIGCRFLRQGVSDKEAAVAKLCRKAGVSWDAIAYMGDDLADLPPMRRARLAIAPADAVEDVRRVAHLVTERLGGRGAVREAVERILKGQGRWDEAVGCYLRQLRSS